MRVLLSALASVLAGCTQLPSHNNISPSPIVNMCGAQLQFSKPPRILSDAESQLAAGQLSKYAKWNITGWVVDEYRRSEVAVCMCREFPIEASEFKLIQSNILAQATLSGVKERVIRGIGNVTYYEPPVTNQQAKQRIQVFFPVKLPSCILLQSTVTPAEDATSALFFENTKFGKPDSSNAESRSPAERLRLLEALKREGLITGEEYNTRKKAVLDSL